MVIEMPLLDGKLTTSNHYLKMVHVNFPIGNHYTGGITRKKTMIILNGRPRLRLKGKGTLPKSRIGMLKCGYNLSKTINHNTNMLYYVWT